MIDWLNNNAGALNAVFSLVVAISTVFYAILTRQLVRETKTMREAQTQPVMSVRVQSHEDFLHVAMLHIENIGAGPAYNVRFSVNPDFELRPGTGLSSTGIFQHGIKFVAPRQVHQQVLCNLIGQAEEIAKADSRFQFTISVSYEDLHKKQHEAVFPVDFLHLLGSTRIGTPALRSIAQDIDKIQQTVAHFASGFSRLRVETFDKADRDDERRFYEEQWETQSQPAADDANSAKNDVAVAKGAVQSDAVGTGVADVDQVPLVEPPTA